MGDSPEKHHFTDALKIPDIRSFVASVAFSSLASRALLVVIGLQIYRLTRSPLALGWLGLVEAVPAIGLVFFGGYVADHFNRRKILLITRAVLFLCALLLAAISWNEHDVPLLGLYGVIFLFGIARGFAEPATTALEAQVVPRHLTVNAASWISSVWLSSSVIGPAVIGFVFEAWKAAGSYLFIALFFLLSWVFTIFILPKPDPKPEIKEPLFKSIATGWRFVLKNQPLWAASALDLFAVLFGGAVALLPIYSEDILHVGARGLGFLNASIYLGSILVALFSTHRPPIAHAGRNLLLAVSGFGVSILIFAFSKNFWLSIAALFLSGLFDGISVVIRRSILRLLSPDHLRGRVASVNWVFIAASNELGAFESGMVAALIGTVPCVALGGVITLMIAAGTAVFATQLRNLRFNPRTLEKFETAP
jgi:MFS family permease